MTEQLSPREFYEQTRKTFQEAINRNQDVFLDETKQGNLFSPETPKTGPDSLFHAYLIFYANPSRVYDPILELAAEKCEIENHPLEIKSLDKILGEIKR